MLKISGKALYFGRIDFISTSFGLETRRALTNGDAGRVLRLWES